MIVLSIINHGEAGVVSNATRPEAGANSKQEVMKIYLKNGAYKSMVITSATKAGDVCQMIAEKLVTFLLLSAISLLPFSPIASNWEFVCDCDFHTTTFPCLAVSLPLSCFPQTNHLIT